MSNTDKNINIYLIHRYLSGECTEQERTEIEAWIARSKENRNYFESIRKVYEYRPHSEVKFDTEKAWKELAANLKLPDARREKTMETSKDYRKQNSSTSAKSPTYNFAGKSKLLRIAAGIMLVMGISYALYVMSPGFTDTETEIAEEATPEVLEFVAERGENMTFEFPDGTQITLHGGSEISTDDQYGDQHRQLELNGQAYFEVDSSQDRELPPFEVTTEEAKVSVLGTSFSVTAWPEMEGSEIAVASGTVEVQSVYNTDRVTNQILNKNEGVMVTREGIGSVEEIDPELYLSWLEGGIHFNDEPLEQVFRYLERRFDVNIEVEEKEVLRQRVTAHYRDESLQEILDLTSVTHNLNIQIENSQITVN